jgi:hypothetical protein
MPVGRTNRCAFIAGLGGVARGCAPHVFPNVGLISTSSAKYDG